MAPDQAHLERLASDIQTTILNLDPKDGAAWIKIRDLTEKLRRATEPPSALINRHRFYVVQNITLLMAADIGLFAELAVNEGKSLSATDLSRATGYHQTLVVRVMRVITALGFADEVGYQKYAANAVTINANHPGAMSSLKSVEFLYPVASKMRDFVAERKPCDPTQTVPAWDYAVGSPFFNSLRENDEWKKVFDEAMTFKQQFWVVPWFRKYPFEDKFLKPSPATTISSAAVSMKAHTFVDVGGNQGVDLQRFADHFPSTSLELVLEDLPETIARLPDNLDSRIKPVAYDFFKEQPIKGADIYYFKSIIHDWDDEASIKILSNTAQAMGNHSRVLINDIVLDDMNERIDKVGLDMTMLFLLNGMERTKTHWTELLAKIQPPLRIMDIWSVPEDEQSVIEACLFV